jgi:hypothetical protein
MEHQGLEGDRPHTTHLSRFTGHEKGDLSKFIEEAVRWRVFHRTVQSIKEQNADTDPGELQRLIDTAVRQVRAEQGAKGKTRKA